MSSRKISFWRKIVNGLSSFIVRLCGLRLDVNGLEKLPEGGYLLVSNHVSMFDPIILLHLLKRQAPLFVSKPENFKIPIAGALMKKCGFLAIDRENPRNAIRTIYAAAEQVREGNPMVIYPEGTRNKTPENGLLPFHNGVFKIAKRAGVPVAVAVVTGTDRVKGNAPLKKTAVALQIVDVIGEDFVKANNDSGIGERVRSSMETYLAKLNRPDQNIA